jgi:Arc/MetJ-type ribon-helix-helix transcriptional regulator
MKEMNDLLTQVGQALGEHGIDFRIGLGGDSELADCTVMCLAGDMRTTVAEMGRTSRDQVVMVRIDEDTKNALDDWVETGAVKSRSEAAALFMREGIKVRSGELEQLREALDDVGQARQRLEEKARQVIGDIPTSDTTD